MQKILALLVVTLSSVTLHAQGVWTEENIDPNTGLRTGVIEVNGNTFTIGPGAFLPDTDLSGADLERVNLSGANLILANLREADLTGADLTGANLTGATLILATLSGADLFLADLSGGNLGGANLNGARLSQANLSGANLSRSNISGADLSFADLSGVNLGSLLGGVSKGNYDELAELKPQVEANTAKAGITPEQASSILDNKAQAQSNTTEINDLKVLMQAMSVQMQQLNTQLGDLQASVAEKDTQIAGLESERDAAIQERDARYTEEQIRALSPDYTMGLNEAGNVEVKISFIASSDATNFAPFSVTADSLTVVDGKISMELPPDQGAFFYRFRIE